MFPFTRYEFDGLSQEEIKMVIGKDAEADAITKVGMVDKLIELFKTKHGIKDGFYKEPDGNYSTYDGDLEFDLIKHFCDIVGKHFFTEKSY